MDTWAIWALGQSGFPANTTLGGIYFPAIIYDLNFWAMNNSQKANLRKITALQITSTYQNVGSPAYICNSNFIPLNGFVLLMICATEGELTQVEDGVNPTTVAALFTSAMTSMQNYLNYGILSTGAPYEEFPKNSQQVHQLIVYAKRGYNFFGSPNLIKLFNTYLPNLMYPYGSYYHGGDVNPGTTPSEQYETYYNSQDISGMKYMFPNDLGIDYAWMNCVLNRWHPSPYMLSFATNGAATLTAGNGNIMYTNGLNLTTSNAPYTLVQQEDCNLVVYNKLGTPVWASGIVLPP